MTLSLTDYKSLLKNTTIQHSERLVTLETCDESDEETWPDQPKDYDKDKDNDKDKPNDKNISRTLAKSAFETFDQSDEEI